MSQQAVRVPSRKGVNLVIGVQLYVVACYLSASAPFWLFRHTEYPPTWLWIVPAWLFGVPGFWVVVAGPLITGVAAVLGAALLAIRHGQLSTRQRWWLFAATGAAIALAVFSLTPAGGQLTAFVLD